MTEDALRAAATPTPMTRLLDIALGYRAAQALYVMSELGVADEACERIERAGLTQRCQVVGDDFFVSVPRGDQYTLFDVIHNWNDEKACAIFKTIRRAMTNHSRLLLIERVLTAGAEPSAATFSDHNGLVLLGGRKRTVEEHRAILAAAGLRLSHILPTEAPWSIVEAAPDENAA